MSGFSEYEHAQWGWGNDLILEGPTVTALTTDEVRDTWVDAQLEGIPTDVAVRLVQGLQIHFDGWLVGQRQQACRDLLDTLRDKVLVLSDALSPGEGRATVLDADDVLAILREAMR